MQKNKGKWQKRAKWALALVLVVANLFLHKPLSDACDALYARLGRHSYEWLMLLGIAGVCAVAALPLLRGHGRRLLDPPLIAALLALGAVSVAAQRWLLVSNVELIHYPQFALLAALLLAAGLGPRSAWLTATAAGVVDEGYQHLVIYAGVPNTYFDYNDILLNGIGATWAVLLIGAPQLRSDAQGIPTVPRSPGGWRRRRGWAAAVVVAAFLLLWWVDPPQFRPLLARAATGRPYRVLSAAEGLAGLALLWGLISLARRSWYWRR